MGVRMSRVRRRDKVLKMAVTLFVLSYCTAVFGTISLLKGNKNGDIY